jgi:hypothetical protein
MYRLIGVGVLLVLLGGCEWLGLSSSTTNSEKARPGAERGVNVTNSLPAARGGGYDASVTALDETRTAPRLGSVVQGKGGQKAQKEAADKDASERDARAKEDRARREREAALRKGQEGGDKKPATPSDMPGPAADSTPATPATPAAPPAPMSTAPLSPAPGNPPAPPSDTKQ